MPMRIEPVTEESFPLAVAVYAESWRESHREICSLEFLKRRDYAGYLRKKAGRLYMVRDGGPVGVFCLDGEDFGDLYIHPDHQGRGYGTACIRFAMEQSTRLRLTVLSGNASAIGLYEKMGFRFTGSDIPLRDGLWEREMVYTEKKQ